MQIIDYKISLTISLILMLSIAFIRPWVPNQEFIKIKNDSQKKINPIDKILIPHLSLIENNKKLLLAISAKEKKFNLKKDIWVDNCEVKQKNLNKFLIWKAHNSFEKMIGEPSNFQYYSASESHPIFGSLKRPASGISLYEANAYCKAAGGRLPTTEEWESIARGNKNNYYPWGNRFINRPWVKVETEKGLECHLYPETDSLSGVHDLSTGLSEWTLGNYPQGNPYKSGGNAMAHASEIYSLAFIHLSAEPETRSPFLGFRCVYDTKNDKPKTLWGATYNISKIKADSFILGVPEDAQIPKIIKLMEDLQVTEIKNTILSNIYSETQPFYMSSTEVSVSEYKVFLRDPLARLHLYGSSKEPQKHSYVPDNWENQLLFPKKPVTGISLWDAIAYSSWARAAIPSEYEWNLVSYNLSKNRTCTVKNKSNCHDLALSKIKNLSDSVSEWTITSALNNKNIVKGGNHLFEDNKYPGYLLTSIAPPSFRSNALGFRLIKRQQKE